MIKKILLCVVVLVILSTIAMYFMLAQPMLQVLNGYAAKKACTCHFVEHKTTEQIMTQDLHIAQLNLASLSIDKLYKNVSSSVMGLSSRRAEYRGDLGCVLINDKDDYQIKYSHKAPEKPFIEYPMVEPNSFRVNQSKIEEAFRYAFEPQFTTEGAMVIYKDSIIHKEYGDNITADTPLLGWSMTKSMTNAIIGLLVKEGKLALDQDHLFPQWTDERNKIRLNDLMQMQSGILWDEIYDKISDATNMLYKSDDIVKQIIENPLEYETGTYWEYSSGTTNLLMGLARSKFASNEEFYDFVFDFFNQAGMNSAFIETDESGNMIGSSYGYATVRDWGKFGQLYLHQGFINGQQLLDTSWVKYSATPVSDEICQYAAQFWSNGHQCKYPSLPDDLYYASGFRGQYVFIIPSLDLVIVRLGNSTDFDQERFVREIICSLL